MKQAVILAGGKGSRMGDRLKGKPKPLVDVCGKPLLQWQIELLEKFGVNDIILLVGHGAAQIEDFCTQKFIRKELGIRCIQDGNPRGTSGAVLRILDQLAEDFLVIYGDTFLNVDLGRFSSFHRAHPMADAVLFLHPNDHPHDSDLVEIDEGNRVVAFHPYPHPEGALFPNLVNAALYSLRRSALLPWRNSEDLPDFGKDLFPLMLKSNNYILGYNSPEYIKDCGTPERLDKISMHVASGRDKRFCLDQTQRAVFLDRDGVLNQEISHLSHPDQMVLLPGVAGAVCRLNASDFRTVVVTNQPVIARGDCSLDTLRQIHSKMENLLGRHGSFIDRLYFCPHHPDTGFPGEVPSLKITCACRKPNPGMLLQAQNDLNISFEDSWLVGDSTVDLATAQKAGIRSILLETGQGGLDGKFPIDPDFTMPDLPAAVDFILEGCGKWMNFCLPKVEFIGPGEYLFIGGLSRSGKSNLASVVRQALVNQGKGCVVLRIDRWLLEGEKSGGGVGSRYRLGEFRKILSGLGKRDRDFELDLPFYEKKRRIQIDGVERKTVGKDDVVVVEGTIALDLMECVPQQKRNGWQVEIDEAMRRERVIQEYCRRGYSTEESEAIYVSRQKDEFPVVQALSSKASVSVKIDSRGLP